MGQEGDGGGREGRESQWALTLARTGGGGVQLPLWFFADSEKTAALRAAGFWATLWSKPCGILVKKFDRVRSGHGAMTS